MRCGLDRGGLVSLQPGQLRGLAAGCLVLASPTPIPLRCGSGIEERAQTGPLPPLVERVARSQKPL